MKHVRRFFNAKLPTQALTLAGVALAGLVLLAAPARAEVVKFVALLDQEQAVPEPSPVADAGGRAYVTLETDSNQIAWVIQYYALSGAITAIHFHGPAGYGIPGDVAVEIDTTSETVGRLTGTAEITAEQAQHMLDGFWYVNIHTELNGPGEIRGQLVRQ